MISYSDLDGRKNAFIFELDDLLYPEKDYWFQVYYLFSSFLEYTELIDAKAVTECMVNTHQSEGKQFVFDGIKKKFNIDEKYRVNFIHLSHTAKLPLKLLLFKNVLSLLQEIVVDRKRIFIVTNGDPAMQLNKIKQTEWHGLEQYLTCYFANETAPKPETDAIDLLISEQALQRKNMIMFGVAETDQQCADAAGIDFIELNHFTANQT